MATALSSWARSPATSAPTSMTGLARPRVDRDIKQSPRFANCRRFAAGRCMPAAEPRRRDDARCRTTPSKITSEAPHVRSCSEILAGRHGTLVRIASLALTLAVWEWYGRGVDPVFISYPTAILAAVPEMIAIGELQTNFLASIQSIGIGLSLAIVFGTLLGLLMGRYRLLRSIARRADQCAIRDAKCGADSADHSVVRAGPHVEGRHHFPRRIFPDRHQHPCRRAQRRPRAGRGGLAEAANQLQIFTKIVIPASLPFIATGIRLAMGRAVVAMVVAEMFTAVAGLGGAIISYGNAFATDKLFVIIIVLALLGVSPDRNPSAGWSAASRLGKRPSARIEYRKFRRSKMKKIDGTKVDPAHSCRRRTGKCGACFRSEITGDCPDTGKADHAERHGAAGAGLALFSVCDPKRIL